MQVRRDGAVLKGQHELDKTSHTGGGFHVAEVGLDRADQERAIKRARCTQGLSQRLHLDGIAQGSAGPVRFHIADRGRLNPGIGQGSAHDGDLRRPIGCSQAIAAAILIDR